MKIITNNIVCEVIDTYTEMKVQGIQGTGVSFGARIDFAGEHTAENRIFRLTYFNESSISYKFQTFGRIWGTITDTIV